MPINNQQLFEIICEQIEAINALTEQLKSGGGGTGGNGIGTIGAGSNYRIQPLIQKISFNADGEAILEGNASRQGFIIVNETADLVYAAADTNEADVNYFSWKIESTASEYYIPSNGAYPGEVNFLAVDPTGYIMVTEFSFQQGF